MYATLVTSISAIICGPHATPEPIINILTPVVCGPDAPPEPIGPMLPGLDFWDWLILVGLGSVLLLGGFTWLVQRRR